ncbi:2-phospho-L-lactate guanylyltransferase [Nocardioides sp. B-3]|uniref:2-phospho-L-lactate guanylyltransferase n=1 Tax=Nocardioides sp. B-3 TaxID=2895565 RepID=UPI002151FEB0|nr:2-phospho-L-lactate guanylyltransferase [Nocardioides sp. B-3]UUZ59868.1 2-phospho-L-lactate guanylyltransferase [Nocardioides sp. B-3]
MTPLPPTNSFVVIVPVKPPARAKSRLDALPADRRRDLAAAFAGDTVAAARHTPRVAAVLVVTDDHLFAAQLRADGCEVIPDGVSDDLNATLQQAAAETGRRWPDAVPVALCADLPCLSRDDLAAALDEVDGPSFVRDAAGTGTTMYAAPLASFDPSFGHNSAALHVTHGAREVLAPAPTLRLDVDDPVDPEHALGLGVGEHTAGVWRRQMQ